MKFFKQISTGLVGVKGIENNKLAKMLWCDGEYPIFNGKHSYVKVEDLEPFETEFQKYEKYVAQERFEQQKKQEADDERYKLIISKLTTDELVFLERYLIYRDVAFA